MSPVPSVLELDEELELLPEEPELSEADELSDVETVPTERDGIEGMVGPDISGMLSEGMLWAVSGMSMPDRMSVRSAVSFLQH